MIGWIKLHRKLLEWEWYDDANASRLFIHCLLKANYEPKAWHGINIERGQFFTSTHTLANELKLTDKQIRGAMQKLSKCENLAIKRANNGTMITICNYDSYQDKEETEGQTTGQSEGEPMANEGQQLKNTKKEKEIKENNIIKSQFDIFRKQYLGVKRGLETEYENFKKQKDYKDVCKLLLPALEKEKANRDLKSQNNQFVPEWKNLKTWINQRCWEQEFEEVKIQAPIKQEIKVVKWQDLSEEERYKRGF